jgi:hypothetical protein
MGSLLCQLWVRWQYTLLPDHQFVWVVRDGPAFFLQGFNNNVVVFVFGRRGRAAFHQKQFLLALFGA